MVVAGWSQGGEEGTAATRAVLGLTLGVGAMGAVSAALIGDGLAVIGIPAAVLAVALAASRTALAASAGAVVWLTFLPRMHAEALLVPVSMLLACLAIALGRERLGRWLREPDRAIALADDAWIEEA